MVLGSNLRLLGGNWWCHGFESLPFWGVNGVVHGRVFESLTLDVNGGEVQ
jgi:hypothetical protein